MCCNNVYSAVNPMAADYSGYAVNNMAAPVVLAAAPMAAASTDCSWCCGCGNNWGCGNWDCGCGNNGGCGNWDCSCGNNGGCSCGCCS
ncbi:MAG: hypothetical protein HFG26_05500 [Provencibacterium sp.]|nr:hypothetical protein [Provencibacterium sp.]